MRMSISTYEDRTGNRFVARVRRATPEDAQDDICVRLTVDWAGKVESVNPPNSSIFGQPVSPLLVGLGGRACVMLCCVVLAQGPEFCSVLN